MTPKYPNVTVQLTGQDGNAFAVLGACKKAIKKAGLDNEVWEEFQKEAMSGDYNHLLSTAMSYFDVH